MQGIVARSGQILIHRDQVLHPAHLAREDDLVAAEAELLRLVRRLQRRGDHRAAHHHVGVFRLRQTRVVVHHAHRQRLVEAAPVHADAYRLVVPAGHLDQGRELLVALVAAPEIAGIDAQLGQGLGALGHLRQQLVAVEMKVADQRHPAAQRVETITDARHRSRRFQRVDGDPHQLRPGLGKRLHLLHGGRDVDGIGVGHRLHHHGRIAADQHLTDPHLAGNTTHDLRHHSSRVAILRG